MQISAADEQKTYRTTHTHVCVLVRGRYLAGVSTKRTDRLVKQRGIRTK